MIIQESSINRFNNVLDNLPVLYDLSDPRLVTIIETDQGNIIRFTDLYNYAQKSGISFNEALNHIENNNNSFELQIAIDEALIYDYPNLLNEFNNLIIMPQSKNSLAYKFCEACLNAYLETGNEGYVNYFLEGEVTEAQNTTGETTPVQQGNQQTDQNQSKPAGTESDPNTTEKKPSWLSQKWAALKQWAAERGIKDIGTFLQYLKGKMFGGDVPNSRNPNIINNKTLTQGDMNKNDPHSTSNVTKVANGTDNSSTTEQPQAGQPNATHESFAFNEVVLGTKPVPPKPAGHSKSNPIKHFPSNPAMNGKPPLPQTAFPVPRHPSNGPTSSSQTQLNQAMNNPNTINYSTTKPLISKPPINMNGQNYPQGPQRMKEDIDLFINEVYRPRRLYRHRYLR